MGLDKVMDEIVNQAGLQKKEILRVGKEEAKRIIDSAEEQVKKRREKTLKNVALIADETKKTEMSSLSLQMRKNILEAKKDLLGESYAKAAAKIQDLSAAERKKLALDLLKKAMNELPDAKYFYAAKKDSEIISKSNPKLKFAGELGGLGGIILENEDGSIRVNYSLDSILQKVREDNLNELSNKLFG